MADKQPKAAPQPKLLPIEKYQYRHKTPPAVLAGVKAMQGWPWGKQVTEADYQAAVANFLKAGESNA